MRRFDHLVLFRWSEGYFGDKNVLTPLKDLLGPRIIFDENDFVRPNDLYQLQIYSPNPDQDNDGPFLGGEPIVFLNACETGTGGGLAHDAA